MLIETVGTGTARTYRITEFEGDFNDVLGDGTHNEAFFEVLFTGAGHEFEAIVGSNSGSDKEFEEDLRGAAEQIWTLYCLGEIPWDLAADEIHSIPSWDESIAEGDGSVAGRVHTRPHREDDWPIQLA